MKIKRVSKNLIALALALCLASCAFIQSSFADFVYENYNDISVPDKLWIYNSSDRFCTVVMDAKYVGVTDSVNLWLGYYPTYSSDELKTIEIPEEDYIIEKRELDDGEHYVIFIRYRSNYGYLRVVIMPGSFIDSEGNKNPRIAKFAGADGGETLYSYKKYDGSYFIEGNYRDPSFYQGDKIHFMSGGLFADEYKVYMNDRIIGEGQQSYDITFDQTGEQTIKICLNEIIQTEWKVRVEGKSEERRSLFKDGWEMLKEAIPLLPLGFLFSLNPLTILPAGAIFGGFFEGIADFFKALFTW